MKFEWNDLKNRSNYKKHGIWFEEALTIWTDKDASEFFNPDNSDNEDRFIRIGYSQRENLLVVVFCERLNGEVIRIISARRATTKERRSHEEGI